jgi:hypothetical protein
MTQEESTRLLDFLIEEADRAGLLPDDRVAENGTRRGGAGDSIGS